LFKQKTSSKETLERQNGQGKYEKHKGKIRQKDRESEKTLQAWSFIQ